MNYAKVLSLEFSMREDHAQNIINMLEEGATIPFIARYRKELTGSCDDQTLRVFNDRYNYLKNIEKRKAEVTKLITEQEKMTDEIAKAIEEANTLTEVEDIYRPFKPKRQTRATIAIAKGLSPLADFILKNKDEMDINEKAKEFISEEKEVLSVEDAIKGAKDIVAETISDDAKIRKDLRDFIWKTGKIETVVKEGENFQTYLTYDNFSQEVCKLPSHRTLAINRGEKEDCLKVTLKINEEKCEERIAKEYVKENLTNKEIIKECIADSFERLIFPSIEREIRNTLTDNANEQAIKNFEINLKPLLMSPPLKNKNILGLDPGYRMGCKIAVIDKNGKALETDVIYPVPPFKNEEDKQRKIMDAERKVSNLIKKYDVEVISIGNGTASKETEMFASNLIKKLDKKVEYMVVSEAGASVYSASKLGAEEFPDLEVNVRSAISIARRLQDPLAELVKIDVKSIGVGQYQHDMPQKRLTESLEGVVEDCVNSVGVDLNTASPSLLSYISGLNSGIAKNIVAYREENGKFQNRKELLKVSKLGNKAFEQSAGFLRIADGENILDNTAVHPESYAIVNNLLKLFNLKMEDLKNGGLENLENLVNQKGLKKVAEELNVGEPTLMDIIQELKKPGRDIRDELPKLELRSDILDIKDLKEGMQLKGTVRNVIDFGAFVDIGVHQDGLVHISEIADKYLKHPSEELSVGDIVDVVVLGVDLEKNRISLSIKKAKKDK